MIEPLIKELSSDEIGMNTVWAAKEMADERLYPALMKLQECLWKLLWSGDVQELNEAIEACKPKTT